MCGRFTLATPQLLSEELDLAIDPPALRPRFNIAPGQVVTVVPNAVPRRLAGFRWGLVPAWTKERRPRPPINARAESLADKPTFRDALRYRRCLVPATGFYEWSTPADGGAKQPYYLRPAAGGIVTFAGLWEKWVAPDGVPLFTMAIVTTAANAVVAPLHDRMPVVIDRAGRQRWLATGAVALEAVRALLAPAPDALLVAHPVSTRINAVGVDEPALIEQVIERAPS